MEKQAPAWWADHTEIAALIRFLYEADALPGPSASPKNIAYIVENPWKWQSEYELMLECRKGTKQNTVQQKIEEVAREVGLDPAAIWEMTFAAFCTEIERLRREKGAS
jgi:hypothetical protein